MTRTLDITAFRRASEQKGLVLPDNMQPGRIVRFPGIGKTNGNKSGWAWLSEDGEAAAFGDWATGLSETWQAARSNAMTPTEQAAHTRRIAELRRVRAEEERLQYEDAAERAQAIWAEAKPAPNDHPYLTKKQVHSHGLRIDEENRLIVPVAIDGKITSIQSIDGTGAKLFQRGGAVKGGSYIIGDITSASTVLICEGFGTGASLHEATGLPTVCAFSAGNLTPVAEQLRQQFPAAIIVICGDHDLSGAGQREADRASDAIKGVALIPTEAGLDWNDVVVTRGREHVRDRIVTALPRETTTNVQAALPNHASHGTGPDRGLVKELADAILCRDAFSQDAGGQLYVFERGTYRPHGDEHIARRVKSILVESGDTKRWSSHRAREVSEFIRVDAPLLWERPPVDTLNLLNGLLDLQSRTLRAHDPAYRSHVQLPVAFDPEATCALWESFVARVLPEDCRTLPFEIVAAAMRAEISDQKAVLFVGPGENGKSSLLEAVIGVLGRENVSTIALQRLEVDKFSNVRLLGKLANVCADLPSDHLTSTSTFKTLTGGDRLTAERKFQGSFEFSPFARLLFSSNHYPTSKDASHAFFRRWLVIPFDAVLAPGERIPNLAAKLMAPSELSGVLNQALAVLPGMIDRGGFTQSESTQASLMEFREMTDPLAAWMDRFTVLSPDGMVTKKDLAIVYNSASEVAGRPLMTAKAFCAAVRRLRPSLTEGQRRVSGDMKHVFLGLSLTGQVFGHMSPHSPHSPHFSQISLGVEQGRDKTENNLKRGNGVNGVNAVNVDLLAYEEVLDDH